MKPNPSKVSAPLEELEAKKPYRVDRYGVVRGSQNEDYRAMNEGGEHDAEALAECMNSAYAAGVADAAALIRQQQAVIDRLPKTADGVPIAPGMLVWEADGSDLTYDGTPHEGFKVLTVGSEHQYERQRKQWVVLDWIGEVTTDRFYSTREAALQATRSAAEQAEKEKP